ncbi:hypothetical protein [Hyalangium versicolor]|uniref:hypothetical protein n=1 Tax=Hyalangium versicolor TaxID=2861190 RepID=UPI001CCE7B77|nr:hypothetical protein [Hyalangium versicolor]
MGYDTSFHPVDHGRITERILPYVLGAADEIDDLVEQAVRIEQVRFRANAWGLGAMRSSPPEGFEPHLHVWGRPFFVTGKTPQEIATGIDAYLEAKPAEVDGIALEMCDALEPGFSTRVTPRGTGTLPPPHELAQGLRSRLDLMRSCCEALRARRTAVHYGDKTFEPGSLLGRELMKIVLEFAAHFRPGWMSRGFTWPTTLLSGDACRLFIANMALVMPVMKAFPDVPWAAADTIHENYMVGGCLSPKDIPRVRAAVQALQTPELKLDLQKLDEALADAEHRHLPFAEATEIYSGVSGNMN